MSLLNLERGIKNIKKIASNLPFNSGVYKMISSKNEVLYVGKAKNLNKRVKSYSNPMKLNYRLQKMVSLIEKVDFIITKNEAYALLLEASLIKELKPKFNILLKDDKTYPYITLRKSHKWCQIKKHRGKKIVGDRYYGPFASVYHVNNTLDTLQKIFPIRTCTDHEIENRKRPCVQYEIKRCTAPCTKLINITDYNKIVENLESFLLGKENKVLKNLMVEMHSLSESLHYEKAATFRDKIRSLEKINQSNNKESNNLISADFFCITNIKNMFAIEIIFFRNGKNFGSNTHYPYVYREVDSKSLLSKFIAQFYNKNENIPRKIFISCDIKEKKLLQEALQIKNNNKVEIKLATTSSNIKIITEGMKTAKINLANKISNQSNIKEFHNQIQYRFKLSKNIRKIEVYDNSHFSGKEAIGSFIVANENGFLREEYRKFNIKEASSNDDYGMMKEVLTRRFNIQKFKSFPDLVIVDGGLGQLSVAKSVFKELKIETVCIIAISKGKIRNASNEIFYNISGEKVYLKSSEPLFYYMLRLRDEAHRFAITTHRNKRNKNIFKSEIDNIENIGPKRKKNLILYFGSLEGIKKAEINQLLKVPGINKNVAVSIYNYFKAT
ncbi:MAG: excinuclease ABC subunit C [Alphaproteobacteria bacterium TMED62]|nr:MAG: excinuclease ABC subunit C [Alphaproteobacteria bacterium TMED62]|tara:strand:+ start:182 stop:2014 length:1833 start_codon:yes stop_codon:yes gene_type:complete